jgi:hypothetical protein
MAPRRIRRRRTAWILVGGLAGSAVAGLVAGLLALLISSLTPGEECASPVAGAQVVPGVPTGGQRVGATEYGGPGDPSSGTIGASGINLVVHPDSYAELGGTTFETATAMGGLPYLTPLRITWGEHSAIAYKRDFGLGGGPVDGFPRVIDLWWQFARGLGIPYESGLWSGPVSVSRPPATGAANLLGQSGTSPGLLTPLPASSGDPPLCGPGSATGVPLTSGERAHLLSNGLAAAPAGAPVAVKEMIAAGNQIVGKPYLYGGGHGLPLSGIAPAYDCSSSVEHLLYGGGLLPVNFGASSSSLESFGDPGPGGWVTLYANPDHVFMYIAGLRWDTHDAAGPGDGSSGIGWHALIRSADGFVARHPVGL